MNTEMIKELLFEHMTECWIWQGSRNNDGYGIIWLDDVQHLVHRLAYELFIGPIPDGLFVLHACDMPPCFRPDHLRAGTHEENMQDVAKRSRRVRGERHPAAVMTQAVVDEARRLYLTGQYNGQQLANLLGAPYQNLNRALRNEIYRDPNYEPPPKSERLRIGRRAHPVGVIGDDVVEAIRSAYTGRRGEQAELVRRFGISATTVHRIVHSRLVVTES